MMLMKLLNETNVMIFVGVKFSGNVEIVVILSWVLETRPLVSEH